MHRLLCFGWLVQFKHDFSVIALSRGSRHDAYLASGKGKLQRHGNESLRRNARYLKTPRFQTIRSN
jgi:hypothetical protein